MSRWLTLALTSVSVLALSAVAAPAPDLAAGSNAGSRERVGSWCC